MACPMLCHIRNAIELVSFHYTEGVYMSGAARSFSAKQALGISYSSVDFIKESGVVSVGA